MQSILVAGGTGFVGQSLLPALVRAGHPVRATTRDLERAPEIAGVEWVQCDVANRVEVDRAFDGMDAAYFLVHGMGSGHPRYADAERVWALQFREVAERASAKRLIYLGGVAPRGPASRHLKSRLEVGEILRGGAIPTLELRASMIIGSGSASWQILRDLAMRLPAMLLPRWTASRTCPIAIEDVIVALVRGLDLPLPKSAWYDIPGPEVLSGREMLARLAALRGRRTPSLRVPLLSVSLSSWWLKLVTRADFALARELVLGLTGDLLPESRRYWKEIGYEPRWTFDEAARRALERESVEPSVRGLAAKIGEEIVQLVSPKLSRSARA